MAVWQDTRRNFCERGPWLLRSRSAIRTMSAVTAACLVIRKTIYEEVGGLDEVNLKVAFNDVDSVCASGRPATETCGRPMLNSSITSQRRGATKTLPKSNNASNERRNT